MFKNIHVYIEKKSKSKFSQYFLSIIAFIESIFFPIPPDIILIPIVYFNKNKYLLTVINCTFFSVVGGVVGYCLGFFIYDLVKDFFDLSKQNNFLNFYNEWGVIAIFLGGFTPIPYKIIALTSGYSNFNFYIFLALSIFSRGLRFLIIGYIIKKFGSHGVDILKNNKLLIFFLIPIIIIALFYIVINHD
tara:strand:- start:1655 stop:2221 length:567 start_codon:yes stop_codon:yes gene_type:complete